jgi:hypothetical protein
MHRHAGAEHAFDAEDLALHVTRSQSNDLFLPEWRLTLGCSARRLNAKKPAPDLIRVRHWSLEKIMCQDENRNPTFTMMQRLLRKINSNTTKRAWRRGNAVPLA